MLAGMRTLALALGLLAAATASAAAPEVGHVVVLQGEATRTPRGGTQQALGPGAGILLEDTVAVGATGQLKLELNDGSALILGNGATLRIDEATFEGQARRGFSARLLFGALWASVKRGLDGSGAKFEVITPRAVTGVRGTTFTVVVEAATQDFETTVGVEQGEVGVVPLEEDPALAAADASVRDPWAVFAQTRRRPLEERIKAGQALRLKRAAIARERFLGGNPKFRQFVLQNKLKRLQKREEAKEKLRRMQERGREQRERLREERR